MEEREANGGRVTGMAYVGGVGNVAKVLLLLFNMAFIVAGCLLVYFSHRIKTSGWMDVFQGDFAWIDNSTLIFMLSLGAVVISLSTLGCFGALLQQKLLLSIYAIVLFLTTILVAVVVFGAYRGYSEAVHWNSQDYPATSNEASLGANFNKLYCYVQVPYYCQEATVNTVLGIFNLSYSGYFSDSSSNFSNVCSTMALPAISQACTVCHALAQYEAYSVVLDWTVASCPRTQSNQRWCGSFLYNVTAADDMSTSAPFMGCRSVFYQLVKRWTNVVMVASIICAVAASVVLIITGVLWVNMRTARQEKEMLPESSPTVATLYPYAEQNVFSQRSEATQPNNCSMYSTAPCNPSAARRRYDSPY